MDDEIVDELYGVTESAALREVTATMQASLTDLRFVGFPDAYVDYRVFWLGHTSRDIWVGLRALRVDT